MNIFKKKIIYLDNAGATPLDPYVRRMMYSYDKYYFGNPSAIYKLGIEANNIVKDSREKIANIISSHSDEIIFTGSGTESDALVILGVIRSFEIRMKELRKDKKIIPHIITTNIEHPAILENCHFLEKFNLAEVTYVKVQKSGIVNPKDIKEALKENTVLVSVMYANNEIGTIQPIIEIAKEIRHYKKRKSAPKGKALGYLKARFFTPEFPLFHSDACQAINYLPIDNIEKLGVDLMSFNGSKIYGPKGIGVLYKKRGTHIYPLYYGGGQELGLRSGTENVSSILGVALALERVTKIKKEESIRLIKLRDYTIDKLLNIKISPFRITLNGDKDIRIPNNINISVSNILSELLVIELDKYGIEVSEKSSCHSSDDNSSYVITAIRKTCGRKKKEIEGSLRISLGQYTTKKDIDILINSFIKILNKYKNWK